MKFCPYFRVILLNKGVNLRVTIYNTGEDIPYNFNMLFRADMAATDLDECQVRQ